MTKEHLVQTPTVSCFLLLSQFDGVQTGPFIAACYGEIAEMTSMHQACYKVTVADLWTIKIVDLWCKSGFQVNCIALHLAFMSLSVSPPNVKVIVTSSWIFHCKEKCRTNPGLSNIWMICSHIHIHLYSF